MKNILDLFPIKASFERGLLLILMCFAGSSSSLLSQDMTVEEKVGQLLMVHFRGDTVNFDARRLIHEAKVGGFIYYAWANGLTSYKQVATLSDALQAESKKTAQKLPLLLACDQEGGVVHRLAHGFTTFASNQAIAQTGDTSLAKRSFQAMAKELQAAGVNMNLAPVVDINNNPKNPIIATRSFGDARDVVVDFGRVFLEAFHAESVITTLKHYPGHGDVTVDSHSALPVVNKSLQALRDTELWPFFALALDTDAIMTAHIVMPAIDDTHCATLSNKALALLRNETGFNGVIVSDSLVMQGVLQQVKSVDEAAIQALNAGCDLLILGGRALNGSNESLELTCDDIVRIHTSICQAVRDGRVAEARVDEAHARIVRLKEKYLLQSKAVQFDEAVLTEHAQIAQEVAMRSVKIKRNRPYSLRDRKVAIFAPLLLKGMLAEIGPKIGKSCYLYFYDDQMPEVDQNSKEQAQNVNIVLFLSYNAWKNDKQKAFIQTLSIEKPSLLLATRDPEDAKLFPHMYAVAMTYSPTLHSIQHAITMLDN